MVPSSRPLDTPEARKLLLLLLGSPVTWIRGAELPPNPVTHQTH